MNDSPFVKGISLGSGTSLSLYKGKMILQPGKDDIVSISQTDKRLQITVNYEKTVTLSRKESRNLEIQERPENVVADDSVTIFIHGLKKLPEEASPRQASSGAVMRGVYTKFRVRNKFEAHAHTDTFGTNEPLTYEKFLAEIEELQESILYLNVSKEEKVALLQKTQGLQQKINSNPESLHKVIFELKALKQEVRANRTEES